MPNFVTRSYPRCHPPAAFPNIPGLDAPEVPAVIGPEPGAVLVFELLLIHTGNDRMDAWGLCPSDRGDAAMKPTAARHLRVEPAPAGPVVRKAQNGQSPSDLVDSVIQEALARHASDVHLEPNESGLLVRFRVHGLLQTAMLIPGSDKAAVTSRIKIMANLDIAEHRLPQDGRIRLRQNGHAVDARVSTVPSLHGEKVVLRLLDLDGIAIPLDNIGLRPAHLEELRRLIRKPQGIIFVTGPTGSGKTSTIYAALNEIKSETINIITIEDPIEYEIAGITQIAIHDKIGLSFANCLRSVLRQDPDVLLVGEVRDQETARIAMQASLTGHLVFATLHTNNAVARASEAELRQCLSGTEGAQTMFQDGLTKVLDGRVAYDEPVRVTEPDQAWLDGHDGHDGPAAPAPPALSLPSLTIVPRS